MALETGLLTSVGPNETKRQYHVWMDGTSVLASSAMNAFVTGNTTGCILMVKATSVAGTPNYTLTLQTAFEDVDATYTNVDAISRPDFIAINDENYHVYTVNFANCMQYARFYITLNPGDGGDDLFHFHTCFMYGDFQHATDVSLEMPVVTLGSVKVEDGTTAANKADVNDANTARTTGTHVIATQQVGADGTVPPTGSLNSNAPFTKVTDGTNNVTLADIGATYGFGVGVFDATGRRMPSMDAIGYEGYVVLSDGTSMVDFQPCGVGVAGLPVGVFDAAGNRMPTGDVVARKIHVTDDSHFGTVGEAADVDGTAHGQFRYIGEAVDNIPALGSAAMAASAPITIATDDTMFTALDTAVDKVVAAVEIMDDWDESDRCKVALPATTGFSVDQSAALEASSETKASAGRLYKVFGRIDSTLASGTYYIQLLDAAALPADGAVTHLVTPIKIIHVAGTDSFFELDLTGNNSYSGVAATNGIVIVSSSTEFTKTITAATFSASVLFV